MKLLDRTLLIVFFFATLILSASAIIQYVGIRSKIETRVDKKLFKEKKLVRQQLEDLNIKKGFSFNTARTSVKIVDENPSLCADSIFNGKLVDSDGELISYRILQTCIQVKNKVFSIQIKKEVDETETFISSLFLTHLWILIAVLVLILLMKFFILKNIWGPFFESLDKFKNKDFQKEKVAFNTEVSIKEFKDLNIELDLLASRIYTEYQDQKSFVENANHELMTPITVILNKIEMLIQSPNLGENEIELVNEISNKLSRLSRINRALVLLSKIDHDNYDEVENVCFNELLDESIDMFEDQIGVNKIRVRKIEEGEFHHLMNADLTNILLMNIIKNAVMHNVKGGEIVIEITSNTFICTNSGSELVGKPEEMFKRFVRGSSNQDSTGLGMSIINKIAVANNLLLLYSVEGSEHKISISKR